MYPNVPPCLSLLCEIDNPPLHHLTVLVQHLAVNMQHLLTVYMCSL